MISITLLLVSLSFQPTYYTNTNYFYEITGRDTLIYGATNGGLVVYNHGRGTFDVLTNTDGLQMNGQTSVCLDSSAFIWVGNDAGLALVDTDFTTVYIYPSEHLAGTITQKIVCRTDSVYVGSSAGLLFIDTKGTPDDFTDDARRRVFGLDILSIAVGDTIWVGTTEGLKYFSPGCSTLLGQYDVSSGLLSNVINKVAVIDSTVYIGTDLGLQSLQVDHFDTLLSGYQINDIAAIGDSLALALDSVEQFGFFYGGSVTTEKSGIPYLCKVLSLANVSNTLFCGLGNRYLEDHFGEGIGEYDFSGNTWELTKRECLPSNHISEITANEHGVFVAHGTRQNDSRGVGWLHNDGTWFHFTGESLLTTNRIHRCVTAPDGKVWFGVNTIGGSGRDTAMVFSYDVDNDVWQFIPIGYLSIDNTIAVWDIEFDTENNMYLTLAGPSDKLWVLDSALNSAVSLGERTVGFNVEIAVDSGGRIWQTYVTDRTLLMIDTHNTLFDPNDDAPGREFGVSDGLLSQLAYGCRVDPNGDLYVANDTGFVRYDGSAFSAVTGITGNECFDVELDSEGRVWSMAREGLFYYDQALSITGGFIYDEHDVSIEFMETSKELIQVQGLEFDALRGCFWLGGETGLLRVDIQLDTVAQLDSVVIYPNPVVGHDVIRIKNIPLDSRVTIYSISGRKLAEDLVPDIAFGEVVWAIPDDVGSGLYFALVESSGYSNTVCKFAIIR